MLDSQSTQNWVDLKRWWTPFAFGMILLLIALKTGHVIQMSRCRCSAPKPVALMSYLLKLKHDSVFHSWYKPQGVLNIYSGAFREKLQRNNKYCCLFAPKNRNLSFAALFSFEVKRTILEIRCLTKMFFLSQSEGIPHWKIRFFNFKIFSLKQLVGFLTVGSDVPLNITSK